MKRRSWYYGNSKNSLTLLLTCLLACSLGCNPDDDELTNQDDPIVEDDAGDLGDDAGGDDAGDEGDAGDEQADCGDDLREGDEECDGEDLNGASCAVFGTPTCTAECTLERSGCGGWVQGYPVVDRYQEYALVVDHEDHIVVTGNFEGEVSFGLDPLVTYGNDDILLAKYSPDGDPLWTDRYGGESYDKGQSITVDTQGNILIGGQLQGQPYLGGEIMTPDQRPVTFFLAKYDESGTHQWGLGFGGDKSLLTGGYIESIVTDSQDDIIIGGRFWGTIDFGSGDVSVEEQISTHVNKFDSEGNNLWTQVFSGSEGAGQVNVLALDSEDNIILTGAFAGTLALGDEEHTAAADRSIFVVKLDSEGEVLWSHSFGQEKYNEPAAVAVNSQDQIIVTGEFQETIDLGEGEFVGNNRDSGFVISFDPEGQLLWSRAFGTESTARGTAIGIDAEDNVIIGGEFAGDLLIGGEELSSESLVGGLLVKHSNQGDFLWSSGFGGASGDRVRVQDIDVFINGELAVVGSYRESLDLGEAGQFTATDEEGMFLMRVPADGM